MFEGFVATRPRGSMRLRVAGLALAVGFHVGLVGLLLAAPGAAADGSTDEVPVLFYAPPPPPPPPPPPAAMSTPSTARRTVQVQPQELVVPTQVEVKPVEVIPEPTPQPQEPQPEPEQPAGPADGVAGGVEGGVTGGVVGGVQGGVVGGVVGGELGSDEPVRIKRGMVPPKPLPSSIVEPVYSRALREERIQGRVLLLVAVGRDGKVGEVKVQSGHPALAAAAVAAIRQWRFQPALFEGRPIAVWFPYPFVFQVE